MLTRRPRALFYCFACFRIVFNHHRSVNKSKRPIRDVCINLTLICVGRHATACMRQHVDLNKQLVLSPSSYGGRIWPQLHPPKGGRIWPQLRATTKTGEKSVRASIQQPWAQSVLQETGLQAQITLDARQHRELYRKCS